MKYLKHPITGKPDLLVTLSVLAVSAATFRFVLDGNTIVLFGHTIAFGHLDPMAYGSFLTPVLAVHGYVGTRGWNSRRIPEDSSSACPDNPDEDTQ